MEWDWTTVSVDWYLVTVCGYCCVVHTLSLSPFTYMSTCCPQKNTPPPTPSSDIEQKQTNRGTLSCSMKWLSEDIIPCGQGWSEALAQSSVGPLCYASVPDVPPPAESKPKTHLSQGFKDIYLCTPPPPLQLKANPTHLSQGFKDIYLCTPPPPPPPSWKQTQNTSITGI